MSTNTTFDLTAYDVDPTEFARLEREQKARLAGFSTWSQAIAWTADLSQERAGRVLGVSHATIHNWRVTLGIATTSPELTAEARRAKFLTDPHDQRHGTANGYRNLRCRCRSCRAAWTAYLRARKSVTA